MNFVQMGSWPRWLKACAVTVAMAGASSGASAQEGATSPAVVVAPAVAEDVARGDTFVGRIRAIQSVSLVSRVEGFLTSVGFDEGQMVDAGEVMFEIEKGPYEASLAAANAQLASAQAQLTGAQATLKNQETVLERQITLLQRDTVSQARVDDATSSRDNASARVEEAKAAVEQAKAQIQTAELNLGYTTITSPIHGKVGALAITEGNVVNSQSGALATVVQLDPIRIAFAIPESLYVQLTTQIAADRQAGAPTEQLSRADFTPTLTLADGNVYDHPGKLAFASNEIDADTGTLVVYADFPNPDDFLLPGGFVRVRVDESRRASVPVVPAGAILQDRDGPYLFVVDSENRVEQRRVEIGGQVPGGIPVTSGLAPGELVVVNGVQKARPGIIVAPTTADRATERSASVTSASAETPQSGAAE